MDYRYDLLKWRLKQLQDEGHSYRTLSAESGVPISTFCDTVRGATRPFPETIKRVFKALGLNPKYAMDFQLKKKNFDSAVL